MVVSFVDGAQKATAVLQSRKTDLIKLEHSNNKDRYLIWRYTYRFRKRQATYGPFEFAQSQDDHRRQTHRIPYANVGLNKNNIANYTLLLVQ